MHAVYKQKQIFHCTLVCDSIVLNFSYCAIVKMLKKADEK